MTATLLRALAISALFGGSAHAGEIAISEAWARATPPGASVAGGYLTIDNRGSSDDRLLSVQSAASEAVEIHSMSMDGGVMRRRRLDEGLALPAGASVRLEPGGLHLMFIRPSSPFSEGTVVSATLTFEHGGTQTVEFPVRSGQDGGHAH